jgi:hypothetical protein
MQPTAMTVRINNMARNGGMPHTELALIAASPKGRLLFICTCCFSGYYNCYIKSTNGLVILHQFHPCLDHASPHFELSSCSS